VIIYLVTKFVFLAAAVQVVYSIQQWVRRPFWIQDGDFFNSS